MDARAKVTGEQRYAADFLADGMLLAGVKRADAAHARLRGVDVAAAAALPGVRAVLTHRDVAGCNRQGVARRDQPVLADDKVRHRGDAVALVVAENRPALERALALVHLDLEPLPGIFDPEAALAPDAPLIHQDQPGGNLLLAAETIKGRGAEALKDCPVVLEGTFHLPRQEHVYLETEAGWARLDPDGRLTIVASTQTPFRDRAEVAHALGLELERVRVVAPQPGGAFGGKDGVGVQSLLGLAALACPGRPVKMWLSREESFLSSPKRHPARLCYRLGADTDGRLLALDADLLYDTGPYDHLGGVVMTLGLEHAGGVYRIPDVRLRGRAVYTNNPVSGAFRGFGVPQANAAMELMMECLARRLGRDPLELRRRNLLRAGDRTPVGSLLECSVGLGQCLDALEDHQLWRERRAWKEAAGPHQARGVGLALAMHGMGYGPVVPDTAEARLELTDSGGFRLYNGVVDMGQGNAVTFARLAANRLDQRPEAVEVVAPDTERTANCGSASASRTTFTYGHALLGAADILRERLLALAGRLLDAPPAELSLVPGAVRRAVGGPELSLAELAGDMSAEERLVSHRYQAPTSAERPSDDPLVAMHGLPHKIFSFGAQLAAVEADRLTGRVEVRRFLSVCDVGRVLEPALLERQAQGGAVQGLGYALWEDMPSLKGRILTPDLATYIIPTACDLPDLDFVAIDGFEPEGPLGLKGAGELPIDGPLPAVAAALADACGLVVSRFPISPREVLEAMASPGREDQP